MKYAIPRILAVVTVIIVAVLPLGVDFDNAELALSQASCQASDGCMPRTEWVCGLNGQNFTDKCPLSSEHCTGGGGGPGQEEGQS